MRTSRMKVQGREFLMMERKAEWVEGANVAERGWK